MTLSISAPTVSSTGATTPPIRTRRPSRLVRNTLSLVTRFCEFDVPQPFPYSDLPSLLDPEQGIFLNSDLTPMGEVFLRQGLELSVRLAIDARNAEALPGTLTPESVQVLLDSSIANSRQAQRKLDLTMRQLAMLNEVASVSFESLLFSSPAGTDLKNLNGEFVKTLEMAGISESECQTPGKLYQAIGSRFVVLERTVMLCDLECLKAHLQVERLRLLQAAGRFLSGLAIQILDEEFRGSDDYLPGLHPTELDLLACADNPFSAHWPSPYLFKHERQAQRKRLSDVRDISQSNRPSKVQAGLKISALQQINKKQQH